MSVGYAISRTVRAPYAETVPAVRAALAEQGFGVLTEIDDLKPVADDATQRLTAALSSLS